MTLPITHARQHATPEDALDDLIVQTRSNKRAIIRVVIITNIIFVLAVTAALLCIKAAADCYPVTPAEVTIIDGDTVDALGERWRLTLDGDSAAHPMGFDTPETFRPHCEAERALGETATARLREMVAAGGLVLCAAGRADRYGRQLGTLSADGVNVGEVLLGEGLARHWPEKEIDWCS